LPKTDFAVEEQWVVDLPVTGPPQARGVSGLLLLPTTERVEVSSGQKSGDGDCASLERRPEYLILTRCLFLAALTPCAA